ncbi:uncharacterized protein [Nicotiana tomentosiformis]|uniref:uncharacterized protein n=1 Tax=Nicotiana tomentosiformis TaxID=4098 RepID=UPI00388CBCD9
MTVSEYVVCFNDLARHAPALVATIRERIQRFIKGLHPSIQISMARELEMDIPYQQVVSIARRLEGMLARDREEREAKRSQETCSYSGARAPVASHGRGYVSCPVHSTLPATSGVPVPSRPLETYYAPPVSSVPPSRGAFSGQSSRPGPSQSQQPHPPRGCFKCGDTRHMMRDCPRLRRVAPLQTSQPLRALPSPQVMIPAPATALPAQPVRGRGRPRRGGQASYYALPAHIKAVASDSVIISIVPVCYRDASGCDAYLAYVRDVNIDTPTVQSIPLVRDFLDVSSLSSGHAARQRY